ncbi:MAG: transposase [Mariprofundaceae bacterium]|nr:transposase [Mariprofundaceae bacterium]
MSRCPERGDHPKNELEQRQGSAVTLFSSDLDLSWDKLVDYYHLRFQIEFNFRDAKQFWGLEYFMVIKKKKIHNSANLATFMVNLSYVMLEKDKAKHALSTHDLKMWFLAQKQVLQVLKTCGGNANGVFIQELIRKISMKTMVNAKDMVS